MSTCALSSSQGSIRLTKPQINRSELRPHTFKPKSSIYFREDAQKSYGIDYRDYDDPDTYGDEDCCGTFLLKRCIVSILYFLLCSLCQAEQGNDTPAEEPTDGFTLAIDVIYEHQSEDVMEMINIELGSCERAVKVFGLYMGDVLA